ncbi:MAG: peroxiredoxin [Tissierellia bacterium]|nr:peroxiredoxin [Tissierellia bacterium]
MKDFKDIKLMSIDGEKSISDYKGKNLVLYAYPKDNTKGCTIEAIEFNNLLDEFKKLDTVVVGISKDPMKSHEKFKDKNDLKFNLLSDEDKVLLEDLDVMKLKKMFGNEYMGVVRSTFIFDKEGNLVKEFRNVKSTGHAQKVLDYILDYIKENL